MKKIMLALIAAAGLALPAFSAGLYNNVPGAEAAWTPFDFALVWPLQIFNYDVPLKGLNLAVLGGIHQEMTGVSLSGVQISGKTTGLTAATLVVSADDIAGLAIAPVTLSSFNRGLCFGGVNVSYPSKMRSKGGLQIGAVNYAENGMQIGVVNYNRNSVVPWMMFFNYSE